MSKIAEISNLKNQKINKIEKLKAENQNIFESFEKLEFYAKNGYDSIPDSDKKFFLKSFGIYDKPLTPKQFMLRVRVEGGLLSYEQALKIGELSQKYCNNYIDLTTRAQIELRYIDIKDIPLILRELESVGITTFQTGVDNFRNILSDPLNALAKDSIIDTSKILNSLNSIFLKKEEWISSLPRKFNSSISGSLSNRCNAFGHDCSFVLAEKNESYGFNVYLGGKVGVLAKEANIFLKDESEVILFYKTLIETFKKYGFKHNRNKNRLHFLIEEIGMDEFINFIKKEANYNFLDAGETLGLSKKFEIKNSYTELKNNTFAYHLITPSGVLSGEDLIEISKVSKEYGDSKISLTYAQNIFILGLKSTTDIENIEVIKKFSKFNNPYFENLISCIGSKHCPYGVVPTKEIANEIASELNKNNPLKNSEKIRLYFSGCPKGCGIDSLGDIGFIGTKVKIDGKIELGFDLTIGGKITKNSKEGKIFAKKMTIEKTKEMLKETIESYKSNKLESESFEEFEERVGFE